MQNLIKHLMILPGVLYFTSVISAQSGTITSGGDAAGSGGSVSFSIGQLDYTSISSAEGTVSQGLQHPYEISFHSMYFLILWASICMYGFTYFLYR